MIDEPLPALPTDGPPPPEGTVENVDIPVSNSGPDSNPFAEQESPFEGLDEPIAQSGDLTATPMRTLIGTLARLPESNPRTENEMSRNFETMMEESRQFIERGNENLMRTEAAIRLTRERMQALRDLPQQEPVLSQSSQDAIRQAYEFNVQTDIRQRAQTALEEAAINTIQDHLIAGRDVEARALLNQWRPERATTAGVVADHVMRRMILAQALERASVNAEGEGWIRWMLTTVLSLPEAILLGEGRARLGIVEDGVGGYVSRFWSFLQPFTELRRQMEAIGSLNATELQEQLPQLIEGMRAQTIFGIEDPGRTRELLRTFSEGMSDQEEFEGNFWNYADIVGLPWGLTTRAMRGSYNLSRLGARRAAANNVARAIDIAEREGVEAAVERTGVTADEMVDNALPRAVNPSRVEGDPHISLAGQVSDTYETARRVVEEMNSGPSRSRWFNEAEADVAIDAARSRLEARAGMELVDVDVVRNRLPDGTETRRVAGFIGPFASEAEATRFMTSRGIYSDVSVLEERATGVTLGPSINITRTGTSSVRDIAGVREGLPPPPPANKADMISVQQLEELDDLTRQQFEERLSTLSEVEQRSDTVKERLWAEIRAEAAENLKNSVDTRYDNALVAALERDTPFPRNPQNVMGRSHNQVPFLESANDNVVEDISGQWFGRVEMDVAETGFYLSPLNTPPQGFISRLIKNASQTSDPRLMDKASESVNAFNKLQTTIQRDLTKAMRSLGRSDREHLNQMLLRMDNEGAWMSNERFDVIWERATGSFPGETVHNAYRQYRLNNDIEHVIRNADMYRSKTIRGFESVRFSALGDELDIDAIIDNSPTVPKERVYNVSDDIHYVRDRPLTPQRLDELQSQGYVMFRTEQAIKLADGTEVNQFLARQGDIEMRPLRSEQLPYRAGGHRLYAHKYFVKQASVGRQPDTGTEFLRNPNVFVTAPTIANARGWAEVMEQARLAVKNDGLDAGQLDEQIFQGRAGFPTGEQFIEDIEAGRISTNHPFEAVFDREQPSFYNERPDISNFIDEDEVGFNGYYRTNGRMYYSPKGEALRDYTGEIAPTLDPFEAQSRGLFNVARLSSFADFKVSAIDRWVRTYRPFINEVDRSSPVATFNSATIRRGVAPDLEQQILGQREVIQRILGFETEYDRIVRHRIRSVSEWVSESGSQKASEFVLNLQERNPVSFLRGVAFDMKLGLFNVGQFLIQTSTMASALALSPRIGARAMATTPAVWTYFLSKGNERVLDELARRGIWRMGGFRSAEEFKNYTRFARDTGFFNIGDTHALVNSVGPANTFGSVRGGADAIRESGRWFFYQAEVWNRLVAHRIAYEEAIERFGPRSFDDFEFRESIAGRARDYSFNMSEESKAWWQNGILSVPTQFWAYNVRMIEALVGRNFTAAQKLRLLTAQMLMAGTTGVPIVSAVAEWRNHAEGRAPDIASVEGLLQRGLFDRMIYEMFGADVMLSERWGTGSWSSDLVRDLFGYSRHGTQRSFADIAGGATYSILGQALGTAAEFAMFWASAEAGAQDVSLAQDRIIDVFRNVSTFSNVTKAMLAYNYGIYRSNAGNVSLNNLPPQDAVFIALGLRPGEFLDSEAAQAYLGNRSETIREIVNEANRLLQEAVARPDMREENAQRVNILINSVPPNLRRQVQDRIHETRDPSIYARLIRRREEAYNEDALIETIANANGEQE